MDFNTIFLLIWRTLFSYIFLIVILKVMGKREMSQVGIFDLVIFLILSELFSFGLNEVDEPILHFVVPIIVIVILEILSAFLSLKSKNIRKFFEGDLSYIIYKGEINYQNMKKNRYNLDDLMLQLRCKDIQSPQEIEYAILEGNGILNIIKKKDLIVNHPEPLIKDGKLIEKVKDELNLTLDDVYALLSKKGYKSIEDIFFAQVLISDFFVVPFKK